MRTISETITIASDTSKTVQAVSQAITQISVDTKNKMARAIVETYDADGNLINSVFIKITDSAYNLLLSGGVTEASVFTVIDYINAGSPELWESGAVYSINDICYYGKNVYTCTTTGTSGTTAPSATSGTIIDGTVVWTYKETLG